MRCKTTFSKFSLLPLLLISAISCSDPPNTRNSPDHTDPPSPDKQVLICTEGQTDCLAEISDIAPIFRGGYGELTIEFDESIDKTVVPEEELDRENRNIQVGQRLEYKIGPKAEIKDGKLTLPRKFFQGDLISKSQKGNPLSPSNKNNKFLLTLRGILPIGEYGLYIFNEEDFVGYKDFQINNITNDKGLVPYLPNTPLEKQTATLNYPNMVFDEVLSNAPTVSGSRSANSHFATRVKTQSDLPTRASSPGALDFYKTNAVGESSYLLVFVEFDDVKFDKSTLNDDRERYLGALVPYFPPGDPENNAYTYFEQASGKLFNPSFFLYQNVVEMPGSVTQITGSEFTTFAQAVVDKMVTEDKNNNGVADPHEIPINSFVTGSYVDLREMKHLIFVAPSKPRTDINCMTNPSTHQTHCNCSPSQTIEEEKCDGIDNDCDGFPDELDKESNLTCAKHPNRYCGNGTVEVGEECDFGPDNSSYGCGFCKWRQHVYVWPSVGYEKITLDKPKDLERTMGLVRMPVEFGKPGTFLEDRNLVNTLIHEIGHTLGLPDIYEKRGEQRTLDGYSLMASSLDITDLTLPEKIKLGWVADDNVLFTSLETMNELNAFIGASPHILWGGIKPYAGIEVRIANGRSLFIESRFRQPGRIPDGNVNFIPGPTAVNPAPLVLVTEYYRDWSRALTLKTPQAQTAFAPDGFYLTSGVKAEYPFAGHPFDAYLPILDSEKTTKEDQPLVIEYTMAGIGRDIVRTSGIKITYTGKYFVDPNFEGPKSDREMRYAGDTINIFNSRNMSGGNSDRWKNVIWPKHQNNVVVRVFNSGNIAAKNVKVKIYQHDYTVNTEHIKKELIDEVTINIPANGFAYAKTKWVPQRAGHYCVSAEIEPYKTEVGGFPYHETTSANNSFRRNFEAIDSVTASPANRATIAVSVTNPFNHPLRVYFNPSHTSSLFRTYLSRRNMLLAANETAYLEVGYEFKSDDYETYFQEYSIDQLRNLVTVSAYYYEETPLEYSKVDMEGIHTLVHSGVATRFIAIQNSLDSEEADKNNLKFQGCLIRQDRYKPNETPTNLCEEFGLNMGTIFASVYLEGAKEPVVQEIDLSNSRFFTIDEQFKSAIKSFEIEYTGSQPYGPTMYAFPN